MTLKLAGCIELSFLLIDTIKLVNGISHFKYQGVGIGVQTSTLQFWYTPKFFIYTSFIMSNAESKCMKRHFMQMIFFALLLCLYLVFATIFINVPRKVTFKKNSLLRPNK